MTCCCGTMDISRLTASERGPREAIRGAGKRPSFLSVSLCCEDFLFTNSMPHPCTSQESKGTCRSWLISFTKTIEATNNLGGREIEDVDGRPNASRSRHFYIKIHFRSSHINLSLGKCVQSIKWTIESSIWELLNFQKHVLCRFYICKWSVFSFAVQLPFFGVAGNKDDL